MMKKYYTLGGLPRSGSTLLCALISQHPDAHASQSTPVLGTMRRTYESMLNDEYYKAKPNEAALNRIVDSIKDSFYYDVDAIFLIVSFRKLHLEIPLIDCHLHLAVPA